MQLKCIKNQIWRISLTRNEYKTFKENEIVNVGKDISEKIAKNMLKFGYAIIYEEKSISSNSYENKAIKNIPKNKKDKRQYKKRYKK